MTGEPETRTALDYLFRLTLKDLRILAPHGLKFMAVCAGSSGLALAGCFTGPDGPAFFNGVTSGLFAVVMLFFALLAVELERKRRHLILLKSLPVSVRTLIWSKYLTALAVSGAVLLAGIAPLMFSSQGKVYMPSISLLPAIIPAVACTLTASLIIRNQYLAPAIPLSLAMAIGLGWPELKSLTPGLIKLEVATILAGPVLAVLVVEAGVAAASRRECDL